MFCRDFMPRTDNSALQERERRFDGIRVQIANRVNAHAVIDGFVLSEHSSISDRLGIRGKIIRHDYVHIRAHIFLNVLRQCPALAIIGMEETEIAAALPDTDYNLFRGATSTLAALGGLAANISLIDFYDAAQRLWHRFFHRSPDAMAEIPCSLIADSEHPFNLIGTHTLAGLAKQVRGKEPFCEREMRVMEDRSRCNGELIAA